MRPIEKHTNMAEREKGQNYQDWGEWRNQPREWTHLPLSPGETDR